MKRRSEGRLRRRRRAPQGGRTRQRGLVRAARGVRARAYAPYSSFRVGAAAYAAGRVFTGCNVENASYGLSLCAERVAVARAVSEGVRRLEAIAIASGTTPPTPPCGMCLQTLAEFGSPEMMVILSGPAGRCVETTLGALLPRAFSKRYL